MVKRCDNANNKCYHIRELHSKGNQFKRMPEFIVSGDSSNSLCLAGDTDDHSIRTYDLLCRRECDINIKCWYELPVVDRSDNSEH